MTRGEILDQAKKTICNDRQDSYGEPENSFPVIAKFWETYLSEILHIDVELSARNVADMLCLFKMARITTGKFKEDNYIDLCGYSAIAASLEPEIAIAEQKLQDLNELSKNLRKYLEDNNLNLDYSKTLTNTCISGTNKTTETEKVIYSIELINSEFDRLISMYQIIIKDSKYFVQLHKEDLRLLINETAKLELSDRCSPKLIKNLELLIDVLEAYDPNSDLFKEYVRVQATNKYLMKVMVCDNCKKNEFCKSIEECDYEM